MRTLKVEVTNTFQKEPQFDWFYRFEQKVKSHITDDEVVKIAKKLAGWTGRKCDREVFGYNITLHPRGKNEIMHINFIE